MAISFSLLQGCWGFANERTGILRTGSVGIVAIGLTEPRNAEMYRFVDRCYMHDKFDITNLANDIAVIRLNRPVKPPEIKGDSKNRSLVKYNSICLVSADNNIENHTEYLEVAGFGIDKLGASSTEDRKLRGGITHYRESLDCRESLYGPWEFCIKSDIDSDETPLTCQVSWSRTFFLFFDF